MTGKLDGFQAISTNTMTNQFCIKQNASNKEDNICTKCYSHTMLKSYRKNMQPSLQRNSDLLSAKVLEHNQLPTILNAFFRFNAHGELINETHLINLVNIALHNPHCNFALWTKRNDIIAKYFKYNDKPKNLILVYSNSKISNIMQKLPKYFDKTFNNVLEDEHVEKQNCTGQQCKNCLLCYQHNEVTTIVEKVKKY
tara:strand:+ start:73 stop:663 length:591 start_codon:yes stop_codon:yes gene_type:complete